MQYVNKYISKNSEAPQWRMTDDGFLRCTARVAQEKILVYTNEEVKYHPNVCDKELVNIFLPGDVLADAESLKSLEGVPVVAWDHTWADPSVIKEASVGSVSGTPKIDGDFLVCDLFITDEKTINQIKNGSIGEISAAYYADTVFTPGEFNGEPFDAKLEALKYNHIAVIPVGHGRAGTDVKIINKSVVKETNKMPDETKLVRVQARNSKKFMNMDEPSAEVYAEQSSEMDEYDKNYNKDKADWELEKTANVQSEESLRNRIKELEGEVAAYKQHMEVMGDQNAIEQAARDMVMEQEDATSILENSDLQKADDTPMDEVASKEYMNSVKKLHGESLHKSVLSVVGMDIKDMSAEALKGAWSVRKQIANKVPSKKVAGEKLVNKMITDPKHPNARTARERLGIK